MQGPILYIISTAIPLSAPLSAHETPMRVQAILAHASPPLPAEKVITCAAIDSAFSRAPCSRDTALRCCRALASATFLMGRASTAFSRAFSASTSSLVTGMMGLEGQRQNTGAMKQCAWHTLSHGTLNHCAPNHCASNHRVSCAFASSWPPAW
eukprot:1156043-Pelagomonas_calceolata.AAC.26